MSNNIDDNDLLNKSDEDLKNEAYKILEEDVFTEAEKFSKAQEKNSYNRGYKDYSGYHNYVVNKEKVYNDYERNLNHPNEEYIKEDKENINGIKIIFIFLISIIVLAILIFCVALNFTINNFYDDEYYEDLYDIEYDLDNDGYLSYKEQEVYRLDRTSDYSEFISIEEFYNDKENKKLFFKVQNRNSYLIDDVYLNIAFYDKEDKLIFVEKEHINNISLDKEVMVSLYYEKEFDHYETTCTAVMYNSKVEDKDADIEMISANIQYRDRESNYVIKNNENESVSGKVFLIFYNHDGNIVNIEEDYVFEIEPGKEYKGNSYISFEKINDINTVLVDTSDIIKESY